MTKHNESDHKVVIEAGKKFLVDGEVKEVAYRVVNHRGNSKVGFGAPNAKVIFTDGTVRFADPVGEWDQNLNGLFWFAYPPVGEEKVVPWYWNNTTRKFEPKLS